MLSLVTNTWAVRRRSMPAATTAALSLGALGVVFGDIGTSPLYVLRAVFALEGLVVSEQNVTGAVSAILWSLMIIVSGKYVLIVLRADNHGQGGILALATLIRRPTTATRSGDISTFALFNRSAAAARECDT